MFQTLHWVYWIMAPPLPLIYYDVTGTAHVNIYFKVNCATSERGGRSTL